MKTPRFWQSRNLLAASLLPLSGIYRLASTLHRHLYARPESLPAPVICVGNLTAGGGGKTPVAMAIGERLKEKNSEAFFLSRGYGGTLEGPVLVNPRIHTAREVGDEPLLLSRILPTVVAKDRASGARFASEHGAKVVVMDDGFQNPSVVKALSLLVIDGAYGFGNGWLLPAGPLREPPASGFSRADAVVVVNPTPPVLATLPPNLPVLYATRKPVEAANALSGKNVVAFCGIAYPSRFFSTLATLGAHLEETFRFADHYAYTSGDMQKLVATARHKQATLVTTAKDAARLSAEWKSLVTVVEISLTFDQPESLDTLLGYAMKQTW